jgi:hypothetical protein
MVNLGKAAKLLYKFFVGCNKGNIQILGCGDKRGVVNRQVSGIGEVNRLDNGLLGQVDNF